MAIHHKTCFVISPIGEPDSTTRLRSDWVFRSLIKPALKRCGLTPVRAGDLRDPGRITNQILKHLARDVVVVADLSERNPNVFYELGIRHALGNPCVQIIQNDQDLPFDLAPIRTVEFSLRQLKRGVGALTRHIKAAMNSADLTLSDELHRFRRQERAIGARPGAINPRQLHHVSLAVRGLTESIRFYENVIGLTRIARPKDFPFGGRWYEFPDGQQLHLVCNRQGTFRDATAIAPRDCHFAVQVESFPEAKARLREHGYRENHRDPGRRIVHSPYTGTGFLQMYILDPDGHIVEINAPWRD